MGTNSTLQIPPQHKEQVGISITVYDDKPDTIVLALMDEWSQSFLPSEANQALLSEVSQHTFALFKGESVTNENLLRMSEEADRYMREHHPKEYTGHVRVRKGRRREGDVPYYTYIGRRGNDDFFREILSTRSMTVIMYRIDEVYEKSSPAEKSVFEKMRDTNKLDEVYALAHEYLGELEQAAKLRQWVKDQANKPKYDPGL
jgi:hypothetical protein